MVMTIAPPKKPNDNTGSGLEVLLTEYEYAGITKRSVASARRDRLLRQGCPYVKLGALVRYRPDDVREYIARNLQIPKSSEQGGRSEK